jgi:hypothetical protein
MNDLSFRRGEVLSFCFGLLVCVQDLGGLAVNDQDHCETYGKDE